MVSGVHSSYTTPLIAYSPDPDYFNNFDVQFVWWWTSASLSSFCLVVFEILLSSEHQLFIEELDIFYSMHLHDSTFVCELFIDPEKSNVLLLSTQTTK